MEQKLRRQYIVTRDQKDIIAIAYEIYGSGGMAGKILRENPGIYQLKAGMVLNLPEDAPQRPATTDQTMRLEFTGLRGVYQPVIDSGLEDEAEIAIDREQLASEIIGLLRENGVLEQKVETHSDVQILVDVPEKGGASELEEVSMDTLEEQVDHEVQEENGSI